MSFLSGAPHHKKNPGSAPGGGSPQVASQVLLNYYLLAFSLQYIAGLYFETTNTKHVKFVLL